MMCMYVCMYVCMYEWIYGNVGNSRYAQNSNTVLKLVLDTCLGMWDSFKEGGEEISKTYPKGYIPCHLISSNLGVH